VSNETTTGDVKRGDTVGHIFTAPDGTVYTLTAEDLAGLADFAHRIAQMFTAAAYSALPIDSTARPVPPALPDEVD
jgi:hypothetical protein